MGNLNSSSSSSAAARRRRSSTALHLRTTAKTSNATTTQQSKEEDDKTTTTNVSSTQKCNQTQRFIKPKHLLWGCSTIEEHYEIVRHACEDSSNQHGIQGLKRIGFEFRKVHDPYPCSCQQQEQEQLKKEILMDDGVEWFNNNDDGSKNISVDGVSDDNDNDGGSSIDDHDDDGIDDEKLEEMRNIFNIKMGGRYGSLSSSNDYNKNNDSYRFNSDRSMTTDLRFSERSAATVFSLATHHSISSYEGESSSSISPRSIININGIYTDNNNRNGDGGTPHSNGCPLRLFHIRSNTMITEKNHQHFIAHGTMYDEISRLCMEYAQDIMIKTGNLEWVTVCPRRNIRALVSKSTCTTSHDDDGENNNDDDENMTSSNNIASSNAVNNDYNKNFRRQRRSALVIITGTGKVGAGIFSRRLSMTEGIESATAILFVEEAVRRDMDLIILDPNNSDSQNAMEAVEVSLEMLCFQNNLQGIDEKEDDISDDKDDDGNDGNDDHGIHILAHSMAGSQLVRFLLNKANHQQHPSPSEEDKRINDPESPIGSSSKLHVDGYLKQIKSVAFTDSNHNINWIKKYPNLSNFFTGQKSIYFKSHKIDEDYKPLGQVHHDCQYWKHRFGTITTLWAGTNEHALTNHTARHHIWDHFDSFR